MNKKTLVVFAAITVSYCLGLSVSHAETIKFTAVDWCPQLCPDADDAGYIRDIINEIYDGSEFDFEVKFYPWSRALGLVEKGRAHGLLAPTKAEAPGLKYPVNEVGVQRVCFFTSADSSFNYTGVDSLKDQKFGAYYNGDFGEINEYMSTNENQIQYVQGDGSYIASNIKKLEAGRIDAFLYTHNALIHEIRRMGVDEKYRAAGCVVTDKLYVGFSSSGKMASKVQSMIDQWDKKMVELKRTDKIGQIMNKYGLEDWSKVAP